MVKALREIKKVAQKDSDVLCLFLFGSKARGQAYQGSDIDVCLMLFPNGYSPQQISRKKLNYAKLVPYLDIAIFQQLPLYIKVRVLKEGTVFLCKDEGKVYDVAFSVIRDYADFEHLLRDYLKEEVLHA